MDVCHALDVVHPARDVAHCVVDGVDVRSSHLLLPRDNVRL